MADPQLLQIPKHPDKKLLDCFINICNNFNVDKLSINVIGAPQIGSIDLSNKENEILTFLFKENGFLIETLTINIEGFILTFYRGGIHQYRGQSKEKSPFYDEIAFSVGNNIGLDQFKRIEIVNIVSTYLNSFLPGRSLETLKENKQLESIHIATLEKLETLNEDLIKTTNEYRIKLDERYNERIEAYEEGIRKKESLLEEEYSNKKIELDNKIEELEKKRKELDDRNNTHARRELRREILKEIKSRQEEFKLTPGTNKLRLPIAFAILGLIAALAVGASWSAYEFFLAFKGDDLQKMAISGGRQILFSIGLIGSFIYLIKWLNRWFEQHSQAEFQLKQLELDMERASWLVETSLEWKDAKGTTIPSELLKCLSKNLFDYESQNNEQLLHPADQLASALLGTASKIKLQSGDSMLEIDPKKLKKSQFIKNEPNKVMHTD